MAPAGGTLEQLLAEQAACCHAVAPEYEDHGRLLARGDELVAASTPSGRPATRSSSPGAPACGHRTCSAMPTGVDRARFVQADLFRWQSGR